MQSTEHINYFMNTLYLRVSRIKRHAHVRDDLHTSIWNCYSYRIVVEARSDTIDKKKKKKKKDIFLTDVMMNPSIILYITYIHTQTHERPITNSWKDGKGKEEDVPIPT